MVLQTMTLQIRSMCVRLEHWIAAAAVIALLTSSYGVQGFTHGNTPKSFSTASLTGHKTTLSLIISPIAHQQASFPFLSRNAASGRSRHSKIKSRLQMASTYEKLMEKIPSQRVIEAVENSPDKRVVASDVATSAGVSLSQARKDLTALASLTKGDIAVSNDGELIYSFPDNVAGVISSNSAKFRALQAYEKVKPVLFYLVRVSFGVVLLASLLAIFSTIFFISSSSSSDSDDRRRDDRGFGGRGMMFGGGYNPWWGPSPFDFFYYRPYYGYYGARPAERRDPDEMGFLESVFSYIFGDGNPNERLEEQRLSMAANVIRQNNGAVTAEQLAPFCDESPYPGSVEEDSIHVDESFVLPIVTQLNGEPQVTDDGDIVYLFPELQVSASASGVMTENRSAGTLKRAGLRGDATAGEIKTLLQLNGISTRGALEKQDLIQILEQALQPMTISDEDFLMGDDPSFLQEKEYEFSLAPQGNRFLAAGLGVVNLLGALYLGGQLSYYASYGIKLPELFGIVQALYPGLLTYAVLFNVIPVIRNLWNKQKNAKIRDRNKRRRLWKTALDSGVGSVGRKLQAARKLGTQMKKLTNKDIYFDTSKGLEDVEKKRQQDALDDFDKLLGK